MKGMLTTSIGYLPANTQSSITTTLNAAVNRAASSFFGYNTKTVNKILIRVSAVTGSLGANDLVLDIFSNTGSTGDPNASLASRNTVTTTPTGAAWVEFTGFTLALTAGTRYWLVLRNANGTPASNFPTLPFNRTGPGNLSVGNASVGFSYATSTDSGATYTKTNGGTLSYRLEFSDGSFDGFPVETAVTSQGASEGVYGTRELGILFTTPNDAKLKVIGSRMVIGKVSSPTFDMRMRIYSGGTSTPTLVATSSAVSVVPFSTSSLSCIFFFSSVLELDANATYRLVLGAVSGGDSSNYARSFYMTFQNVAASTDLLPFNGTMKQTYSTDGVTFTETDARALPYQLLLDSEDNFASTGSSGVTAYSRGRIVNAT